jgi:transposase InsO family protein
MRRGFLYLVAIMDWYSRKVLAWRLSNSMDADFCVEALNEALVNYGTPEIFNTPSRDIAARYPAGHGIKAVSSPAALGSTC